MKRPIAMLAGALCATLAGLSPALSQQQPSAPLPAREPGEENAAARPLLSFGNDVYFVKPILAMAGGIQAEFILDSLNRDMQTNAINKEDRVTAVALTRFGLEGRLGRYVSFRSEFERNLGAHGSGVWEGTASFSSRDQFLRLQRWGFVLDGGIILDEASIDFFSAHTADLLLADKYTRNPLLYSGFNRGQGAKLSYGRWGLRLGLSFTAGNPLSTSSSFQVGGSFAGNSRFWQVPLGDFRAGQPNDDFHFMVVSPSLTYDNRYLSAKAMMEWFWIDYQANSRKDPNITGYNLRGNLALKLPPLKPHPRVGIQLVPFGNVAWVTNQVLNNTAGYSDMLLSSSFSALSYSAGLDIFVSGRSGLGFSYARVSDESPSFVAAAGGMPAMELVTHSTQTFANVGATCWITEYVAAGLRFAYFKRTQDNVQNDEEDASFFATLRLVL